MTYYLGIDVGGTSVKLGIINHNGELLVQQQVPVDFDHYQTPILQTVLQKTKIFLQKWRTMLQGYAEEEVAGIGIAATGQIDCVTGSVVGTAGHLPNYLGSTWKETFEEELQLPVAVANDANCAVLGETWKGAAQGLSDVVMLTIGTGVGGGIITGGRLLVGARGLGGEIGHVIIQADGERCSCKNYGCLEHYASTTALLRLVKKAIQEGKINGNIFFSQEEQQKKDMLQYLDGKKIFGYLKSGEKGADMIQLQKIIDIWEEKIVDGMISFVHIFEPQKILLGGGVSEAGEILLKPLEEKLKDRVMPAFAEHLTVEGALLGNTAGMIGAVRFFMLNL